MTAAAPAGEPAPGVGVQAVRRIRGHPGSGACRGASSCRPSSSSPTGSRRRRWCPPSIPTTACSSRAFSYHFTAPARGDIVVVQVPARPARRLHQAPDRPAGRRRCRSRTAGVRERRALERALRAARSTDSRVPTDPAPALSGSTMTDPWSLNRPYTVPPGHYFMMGDNRHRQRRQPRVGTGAGSRPHRQGLLHATGRSAASARSECARPPRMAGR